MLDRQLQAGDYVVFYNAIYQVKSIPDLSLKGHAYVQIILMNKSKTTRPQMKYSRDMYLIHKDDLLIWKIKNGS